MTSHPSVSLLRKVLSGVGDKPDIGSDLDKTLDPSAYCIRAGNLTQRSQVLVKNNLVLTETPAADTTVTIPSGTQL